MNQIDKRPEAKKFYIRSGISFTPDTEMMAYAKRGFRHYGIETENYFSLRDIFRNNDLSADVGVAGWILDVNRALDFMKIPRPSLIDYPDELHKYLGREIWRTTLGDARKAKPPVFIKPAKRQKLFTGMLWEGTEFDIMDLAKFPDEEEVWCSDKMEFVSEYRTFIIDREIVDCRRYKGDWSVAPDKAIVEQAVVDFKSQPRGYSLDFGVSKETGKTHLIEANDGFSIGHYGLEAPFYAQMLSARWHEIVTNAS